MHELRIRKRQGGEGTRLWVDDLDGLLGLLDIGAVELHPWNATVDDIEHPDQLVFDLDPGTDIEWSFVIESALALREILRAGYTLSAATGARSGRLFIDYLRNGRGTTAIGTYSPRARAGFTIAAPVTWTQLENGIRPDAFSIHGGTPTRLLRSAYAAVRGQR